MLIDRAGLAAALNSLAVLDPLAYPDPYMADVLASAGDGIARHLDYDPALRIVQDEEGLVTFCEGGDYAGRYMFELAGRPLVPGPAAAGFASLQLTYGYAALLPTMAAVGLPNVAVQHNTGYCYALAGAGIDALAAYTFASVSTRGVRATGYVASYAAGYATGVGDPAPNGGGTGFAATAVLANGQIASVTITSPGTGYTSAPLLIVSGGGGSAAILRASVSAGQVAAVAVLAGGGGYVAVPAIAVDPRTTYGATPLPAGIRRAAALLCRERLAVDDAANGDPYAALAGPITAIETPDIKTRYQGPQGAGAPAVGDLGYGTALAREAARALRPYRRSGAIAAFA